MPIYKPSELFEFLEKLGISPKKGLSQNFLIDGNILRKIITVSQLSPNDLILEIGPGPGCLTEELLKEGVEVIAVEKDPIYAQHLDRLKTQNQHLHVFCEDILSFPIEEVFKARVTETRKAKVIANLPYHLTTPIIAQLITQRHLFSSLILMVQDEVARRFVAKPKTSDYSSFSVFLNFYSRPHYAFTVNSTCFYPRPRVNSAIVVLELKPPPPVADVTAFFKLTRTAFMHRRKMLRSSLKDLYSPLEIEKALLSISESPLARPEELSLDKFLELFKILFQTNS